MVMFKVKRMQDLHSILISLTDHWSDKKIATCSQVTISFQNTRSIKPNGISVSHIFDLNAEKHSPASSVQSTKRWVSGMLMSVGIESSHWQVAKRLRSWASSEADCECPLYDSDYYLINWALCLQRCRGTKPFILSRGKSHSLKVIPYLFYVT